MIFGVGIDLLNKKRIEKVFYKFPNRIVDKVLSDKEKGIFKDLNNDEKKINFIAKRFSAKESFLKALGIGMGRGLKMKNINVFNDKYGRPFVELDEISGDFVGNLFDCVASGLKFDLSITDEGNMVNTVVVVSKCAGV